MRSEREYPEPPLATVCGEACHDEAVSRAWEAVECADRPLEPRPDHNIDHAKAFALLLDLHLRPERRVFVHVLDVTGESGVGVMEQWLLCLKILISR